MKTLGFLPICWQNCLQPVWQALVVAPCTSMHVGMQSFVQSEIARLSLINIKIIINLQITRTMLPADVQLLLMPTCRLQLYNDKEICVAYVYFESINYCFVCVFYKFNGSLLSNVLYTWMCMLLVSICVLQGAVMEKKMVWRTSVFLIISLLLAFKQTSYK